MQVFVASYRHYLMGDWEACTTETVGVYSSLELAELALEEACSWVREQDLQSKTVKECVLDDPLLKEVA